jgi:hypothetical protein
MQGCRRRPEPNLQPNLLQRRFDFYRKRHEGPSRAETRDSGDRNMACDDGVLWCGGYRGGVCGC